MDKTYDLDPKYKVMNDVSFGLSNTKRFTPKLVTPFEDSPFLYFIENNSKVDETFIRYEDLLNNVLLKINVNKIEINKELMSEFLLELHGLKQYYFYFNLKGEIIKSSPNRIRGKYVSYNDIIDIIMKYNTKLEKL